MQQVICIFFQQTLVKDNALISDLIKEIEKTYSKLCSAKYVELVIVVLPAAVGIRVD